MSSFETRENCLRYARCCCFLVLYVVGAAHGLMSDEPTMHVVFLQQQQPLRKNLCAGNLKEAELLLLQASKTAKG